MRGPRSSSRSRRRDAAIVRCAPPRGGHPSRRYRAVLAGHRRRHGPWGVLLAAPAPLTVGGTARRACSARRGSRARCLWPYAIRKPKGYPARAAGDLVGVDTTGLRPLPGVSLGTLLQNDPGAPGDTRCRIYSREVASWTWARKYSINCSRCSRSTRNGAFAMRVALPSGVIVSPPAWWLTQCVGTTGSTLCESRLRPNCSERCQRNAMLPGRLRSSTCTRRSTRTFGTQRSGHFRSPVASTCTMKMRSLSSPCLSAPLPFRRRTQTPG